MVSIKELAKFGLVGCKIWSVIIYNYNSYLKLTELFKLEVFLVIVSEFCSNTMYTVEKSLILLLLNDTLMRICKYC